MDDEFKLCWKNFQDNIASGFQNLYDRGDLVDVTLACDGKLLHAHKIVLAICSPYFQEIFITNPCKHPIIILKDVTFNIMCELLEFMYQGVVNVKHTELQSFMKIGQLLQIKGLATNTSSSAASTSSEKSSSQTQNQSDEVNHTCNDAVAGSASNVKPSTSESNNHAEGLMGSNSGKVGSVTAASSNATAAKTHSPASSPSPMGFVNYLNQPSFKSSSTVSESNATSHYPSAYHGVGAGASSMKRHSDLSTDALSIYSRKQFRRTAASSDHNSSEHNDGTETTVDQVNAEDFFLPHISMVESRYDLNNVKREGDHHGPSGASSASSLRSTFGPSAFNFDYNLYKNSNTPSSAEYPNELHLANDYTKNFGNHMDIPPIAPGEHWFQGKLEFMLSQRGKPLLVHDGHTFGIQYVRKDKKYWQCNLSRKFNCKARVTTTDTGEIIVTNNEHCHTEIRQHLRKDYQRNKVMMNALINLSTNRLAENLRRQQQQQPLVNSSLNSLSFPAIVSAHAASTLAAQVNLDGVEHGILDLGKTNTAENLRKPQTVTLGHDDDEEDNDAPLDCGIRSAELRMVEKDGVIAVAAKDNNACHDSRVAEDNWKCRDTLDSQ